MIEALLSNESIPFSAAKPGDRAMGNFAWTQNDPYTTLYHLPFIPISIHYPVLLATCYQTQSRKTKIGRRYERW